jgi:hypothetical protein
LGLASCGGRSKGYRGPTIAPNATVGECAQPDSAGVLSKQPSWKRADRDLDGDGHPEQLLADRNACRGRNCYWNIFDDDRGCRRYIGTVSGAALELAEEAGSAGFRDLRGWWRLGGGQRQLLQSYRYRDGGYQLVDVLLCRQASDDRLLCAQQDEPVD